MFALTRDSMKRIFSRKKNHTKGYKYLTQHCNPKLSKPISQSWKNVT